jgi:RNA polymerase sigma-70 factor (ECF subfamily)
LYLVFNEGYLTRGERDGVVRVDLVDEALRLTRTVRDLLPDRSEVEGLLALELFHAARLVTRVDGTGELVLLEDQDRTRWDLTRIREANAVLHSAMRRGDPGPYQVQAVIAGHHANARTAADTDWSAIAGLYGQLLHMTGSPVVALNHAVAVAMADGPDVGLVLLDGLTGLDDYHLYHSARAELLVRAGRPDEARAAFIAARGLAVNPAEQRHLDRRTSDLG